MRGLTTIAAILGICTACGSGGPSFSRSKPEVIKNPPEVVQCGFGAQALAGLQDQHWDQWCERSREMHGPFERYSLEGTLLIRGEFAKNEPTGTWEWFHPSGDRMLRGGYTAGSPIGEWEWRHKNGETAQRGTYLEGVRDGQWITYFEDRTVASDGLYAAGVRAGNWKFWTPEGLVMRDQDWKDGTLARDEIPEQVPELVGP